MGGGGAEKEEEGGWTESNREPQYVTLSIITVLNAEC